MTRVFQLVFLFAMSAQVAIAADAKAIMTEVFDTDDETTTIAFMDMTLIDANGSQQARKLKMEQGLNDKQLMWFVEPNDLRGFAFLQMKIDGDDRMWMYMPSLKVTNRISGKRKRDSFMGSEFTYEDMSPGEIEDFEFTYVREDTLDGKKVHVIDGKHLDKNSGYSKTTFYVEDQHKEILKADMYKLSGSLQKVMTNEKIEVIDGRRIPTRIVMKNMEDGDSTILEMRDIKLDQEIPDSHFSQRYLPKVR